MLSPHTSYPVLEMAACGGLVVTNTFSTKTAERFTALSPNIIAVAPTAGAFTGGLLDAAKRVAGGAERNGQITLPTSWAEALSGVERTVRAMLAER
jgi:O-antigen biosynthesis protein